MRDTADSANGVPQDVGEVVAAAVFRASEILVQTVDTNYTGPGKVLVQFAWYW